MLLAKKCHVFRYLNCLKKTRNNAFLVCNEKKKPFLTIKTEFFNVQKIAFFFHAFSQKMPIFSLLKFDQTKPRNNAF